LRLPSSRLRMASSSTTCAEIKYKTCLRVCVHPKRVVHGNTMLGNQMLVEANPMPPNSSLKGWVLALLRWR
jgi:hypothetical protein